MPFSKSLRCGDGRRAGARFSTGAAAAESPAVGSSRDMARARSTPSFFGITPRSQRFLRATRAKQIFPQSSACVGWRLRFPRHWRHDLPAPYKTRAKRAPSVGARRDPRARLPIARGHLDRARQPGNQPAAVCSATNLPQTSRWSRRARMGIHVLFSVREMNGTGAITSRRSPPRHDIHGFKLGQIRQARESTCAACPSLFHGSLDRDWKGMELVRPR